MFKTLAGVFMAVAIASGADLTGIWTGVLTDRNGDLQDVSFRFQQDGGALTGKMYGENESVPITEGKIEGGQVTFVVTTELNGSISRMVYTGTLANGEIQVTRKRAETPGTPDLKPDLKKTELKADPEKKPEAPKPNQKQTFVLKRL